MQERRSENGLTLAELTVVMAIIGILTQLACSALLNTMRRFSLRAAAVRLEHVMRRVQYDASGNSRNRALRFFKTAQGWQYAVYQDEDGDGVLNADMLSGVDVMIEPPVTLDDQLSTATIGLPDPPVSDPDTGLPFSPAASPINFNQSSICSFAPNGDGTPGTIYLVNGTSGVAAMVRSSGKGGNIRSLFYGFSGSGWQ